MVAMQRTGGIVASIVAMLLATGPAAATTYYVRPGGRRRQHRPQLDSRQGDRPERDQRDHRGRSWSGSRRGRTLRTSP